MHSWGISPARGLRWLMTPSSIQFIPAYIYKACTTTRSTSNVPVCWCCCCFSISFFFFGLVWSQVVHVNIIVFVVSKRCLLLKKQWNYLTMSLYSLVFHKPGEIGCESTKYISAPSQSLQIHSSEDGFQSSLLSRPLSTTHTHTHIQNVEN